MPKQKKAIKYKKEQEEIIQKIITILDATNKTFILYDIDNDEEKQEQIYSLIDDIKKYFSSYNIGGLKEPERYKRTWLSIVRQLLKKKYNVISGDLTITKNEEKIRTRIYTLIVKYHGLLRYKSVPNSELNKQILVNRDVNGSLNIRMIALYHINKKKIPIEFSRKKQ
jgi:hypothetical protein